MKQQPTEQKIQHSWGESRHLYVGDTSSLAVAIGRAGGASSLHVHHDKSNAFIVHEGIVEIWSATSLLAHLHPQKAFVISASVVHRMVFLTDAVLHELYQANVGRQLDLTDIIRIKPGWKPGEKEVKTRLQGDFCSATGNRKPVCFPE